MYMLKIYVIHKYFCEKTLTAEIETGWLAVGWRGRPCRRRPPAWAVRQEAYATETVRVSVLGRRRRVQPHIEADAQRGADENDAHAPRLAGGILVPEVTIEVSLIIRV
jgi:hypothetical protein